MIGDPGEPQGGDPLVIWLRKMLAFTRRHAVIEIHGARRIPQANGGVIYEVIPAGVGGGGSSDSWPPSEIDPSVVTPKGAYKYVSPQSDLAVTGMTQLTAGDNLGLTATAPAGRWRAVKDVPAAVAGSYNVPQIPPQLGAPTGTPLKGDAEGDDVFWLPEWIYDYCL